MNKRKLGNGNLDVSAIGQGCMSLEHGNWSALMRTSEQQQLNLLPMIFVISILPHQRSRYMGLDIPKSWSK